MATDIMATSTTKLTHSIRLAVSSLLSCFVKNAFRFARRSFFLRFTHYLQVTFSGPSSAKESFKTWLSFCESKLRILILGLELPEEGIEVYPFVRMFEHEFKNDGGIVRSLDSGSSGGESGHGNESGNGSESSIGEISATAKITITPNTTLTSSFFLALRFKNRYTGENIDLTSRMEEFLYLINSQKKEGQSCVISHMLQGNLPLYVHGRSSSGGRRNNYSGNNSNNNNKNNNNSGNGNRRNNSYNHQNQHQKQHQVQNQNHVSNSNSNSASNKRQKPNKNNKQNQNNNNMFPPSQQPPSGNNNNNTATQNNIPTASPAKRKR